MNIHHYERKRLLPQHQNDAFGAERITSMIHSGLRVGDSSLGSLFGRSPSRSIYREQHSRRNRNCIAHISQRGERITSSDGSSIVNSNFTSSPFSRRESRTPSVEAERYLSSVSSLHFRAPAGEESYDDDTIDPVLSALLLDEILCDEIRD